MYKISRYVCIVIMNYCDFTEIKNSVEMALNPIVK